MSDLLFYHPYLFRYGFNMPNKRKNHTSKKISMIKNVALSAWGKKKLCAASIYISKDEIKNLYFTITYINSIKEASKFVVD